jgi:hypothetical protein
VRPLLAALALAAALTPAPGRAQGAVDEVLEELGPAVRRPPTRTVLPARVDLTDTLPPPRGQGTTSSCTSWSTTYGAATQALRRADPAAPALSPASTYNRIADDPTCQRPTRISETLDLLRRVGALPLQAFAFDGGWCGRVPSAAEIAEAARYRIRGWNAFDAADPDRVKGQLADGRVVIVSIPMTARLRAHRGEAVFAADGEVKGRHAIVAVGYDDARGAFRIQNSWGIGWGDGGYAWFDYAYWRRTVRTGFVIE